jgi:hypothetical protein
MLSIGSSAVAAGGSMLLATLPVQPWSEGTPRFESSRNGIAEQNEVFRQLAREQGWMLADLERQTESHPEFAKAHFLDLVHVDPEGNLQKAQAIAEVLVREWKPLMELVPRGR